MNTNRQPRRVRVRDSEPMPAEDTIAWYRRQLRIMSDPERTMSLSATRAAFLELTVLYKNMVGTLYKPMVEEELDHLVNIYVKYGGLPQDLEKALVRY